MKKIISFLTILYGVPCLIVIVASIFFDEIQIGAGGNSLEHHLMGKNVMVEINGLYKGMDVEEYVLGVLPGTIPADYSQEAINAQAILIRTNVLREMLENNTNDAADLSYEYLTVEERHDLFGQRNYDRDERKFEQAVVNTAGKVIKQEDSLIMALYHEVSIGKTASAKEVLGEDIAYLQSVDSPHDVEAKGYMNIVSYSWQEVSDIIKEEQKEEEPSPKEVEIQVSESTENGFVKEVTVDGKAMDVEEAKERFELDSSNFYVEEIEDGVRFVCLGKGNCLGVSLYGANYLAMQGEKYDDIITYYYKNVTICEYKNGT